MLAEIAPLAVPQFDALLVSILAIAGCFVALGLVTVLHSFVRATVGGIAGIVSKVPYIGGVISSPVNVVEHWMEHEFSAAELALDKTLARFLHSFGQLVHWLGQEIRDLSQLGYILAATIAGSTAVELLARLVHNVDVRVRAVESVAESAIARIHGLERSIWARLDTWIEPQIHRLEHALSGVIETDIPGLRAWVRELLDRAENTWHAVRRLDALTATGAIAAATAVALGELGLTWIRCRNWKRIGEGVCGLPFELIDALALGVFDVLLVTDLCDMSALMGASAREIEPLMLRFVDVEEALVGCHGNTAPRALTLPALELPPVTGRLRLSAR